MDPKSGQTNNSPVAKLITLNLLLASVKMIFRQNGGQTNNSRKGQKVDKLITLRQICVYIYIYTHIYVIVYSDHSYEGINQNAENVDFSPTELQSTQSPH